MISRPREAFVPQLRSEGGGRTGLRVLCTRPNVLSPFTHGHHHRAVFGILKASHLRRIGVEREKRDTNDQLR